jgi:hypothetical protein
MASTDDPARSKVHVVAASAEILEALHKARLRTEPSKR